MEVLSNSSKASHKPGRRSFPNLQHLSLAPLSSRFPIDDSGVEEAPDNIGPLSSYIQGKSAPNTPGILSKPRQHKRGKSLKAKFAHESYFPSEHSYDAPLAKSKSASAVPQPNEEPLPRLPLQTPSLLSPIASRSKSKPDLQNNDEWLHRAGLLIASETRETKGQSWLISRDSSTSLVKQDDENEQRRRQRSQNDLEEFVHKHQSRAASRAASRAQSRAPSARQSRRGSRVGSRADFLTPFKTLPQEGYFDEVIMEPDFVEKETEEDSKTDAEIQRLSKQRSLGLGHTVDRWFAWPLFNVEEPSDDEHDVQEETVEQLRQRKRAQMKRREEQLKKVSNSSASATNRDQVVEPPRQEEEGGWKDVAWLLSVASKVVL